MQTKLQTIARKAKENRNYQFFGLYTMLNEDFLLETWHMLNKRAACGVDKISYQDYNANVKANVKDLVERLKRKAYRAKLVRRHYIPKANGKLRPLGIPATEDKLLQLAVSRILTAIYEEDFHDCMYGYRPGKSPRMVLDDIQNALQFGKYKYIVEADIKGYFENLDHDWLIKMLKIRIKDEPMIRLIRKWLKAGVLETDGKIINPLTGTPQGGIISPLLANLYMHYVIVSWFNVAARKQCVGKARLFVYADDFIGIFENRNEAEAFYRALPGRLKKFNLEVAVEKTKIIKFDKDDKGGSGTFDFLGFTFRHVKSRNGYDFVKRVTIKKRFQASLQGLKEWCKENRSTPLKYLMSILISKMRGYINYYGLPGNDRMYKFVHLARIIIHKWLNRRSQRKSYTWETFTQMLEIYGFPQPRMIVRKRDTQLLLPI